MARKLTTKAITDDAITADKIVAGAVVADIGAGTVTPTHLHSSLDLSTKTVTLPSTASTTGDLTLDVAGNITLNSDGNQIMFADDSISYGRVTHNSSDFTIQSDVSDKDIVFKGNSGGTLGEKLRLNSDGRIAAGSMAGLNHTIPPTHGDGKVIYSHISRYTQNCSATNLDMHGSKWTAHKSGSVTMTALMFITSGSYYFNFKVKNLSDGSYVFNAADGGGFGNYLLQGGNVHAEDAIYRWNVSGLRAGDEYVVEMSASSGNGQTLYTNTSQDVSLSNFEVTTNDAQNDQSTSIRVKAAYFSSPSPSGGGVNGAAVYNAHTTYRHAFNGSHRLLVGHFGFRAYAQYMDFKTNLNSNSYMFMFEAHGYFYGAGQMMCSRGGYMYTGNSVINQQESIPSTNQSCKIYNFYRSSDGMLCGKIQKNHNSYTEGQLYLYWARFGGNDSGMRITAYSQNNTTSNIF